MLTLPALLGMDPYTLVVLAVTGFAIVAVAIGGMVYAECVYLGPTNGGDDPCR